MFIYRFPSLCIVVQRDLLGRLFLGSSALMGSIWLSTEEVPDLA